MTLTAYQFKTLADFIFKQSGITLTEDKTYLLDSRLLPIARTHGMSTVGALADAVAGRASQALLDDILDAMTTNETSFFRDLRPFERIRDELLPNLLQTIGARPLRIWSAACSSGQEVYTLAMLMREYMLTSNRPFSYQIIGTDLSPSMVQRAQEGAYTQFEIQRGLPIQLLMKYFTQAQDKWQVKPELKQNISFRQHNLLHPPAPEQWDMILCRNVLIYFDAPTKTQVLRQLSSRLHPHGSLILGASETTLGLDTPLKAMVNLPGFYTVGG